MIEPILSIEQLRVCTDAGAEVIADITFDVSAGEVLGIAGESGCGKSTLAMAMLGYSRPGLRIAQGAVRIGGDDILALPERDRRAARGGRIAYVSQDASKSLNPSYRVRDLVREILETHGREADDSAVGAALERVYLPSNSAFRRRYPHQLSGGQQQRLAIGIGLACGPSVLVLDEPTTGLDVLTQARILAEVERICRDERVASVFVSHDLAAMSSIATRIAIIYAGRIVEERAAHAFIRDPKHPYSAGLVGSVPVHTRPEKLPGIGGIAVGVNERPTGCAFAPRCAQRTDECEATMPSLVEIGDGHRVRCLHWPSTPAPVRFPRPIAAQSTDGAMLDVRSLVATHGRGTKQVVAADAVSFSISPHECVALVGESGSGKSTIARCVAGLHRPDSGVVALAGRPLAAAAHDRSRVERQGVQIVFQNPYDSLNPAQTVEESVGRPLQLFFGLGRREAHRRVPELMSKVRLPARLATRYPRELSGGERQRVAIARALAAEPDLLICDEVTSSLDVSVQAAVLDLLGDLDIAILFITHDFGVVATIADRVLVLQRGIVREEGVVDVVLRSPISDYSQQLIAAIPELPVGTGTR